MSTDTESPFDTVADSSSGRTERYRRVLDLWVFAPLRIVWADWRARVGMSIVLLYILMATVGVVVLQAPNSNQGPRALSWLENLAHPLGTDIQGRWMLSLIVHATPAMLKMILAGGVFATVVAIMVGVTSGYKGGTWDRTLMTLSDVTLAIPGFVLAIVLAMLFEPENPFVVGLILSVNAWGGTARQLRSQVLSMRNESYVEASYVIGVPTPTIILNDLLPNLMPFVLVKFVQQARNVIYSSVALYYLGVLPFSNLNWGVVLNQAQSNGALMTQSQANWIVLPMAAIVLLALGLIFLAQGMDRLFNPRIRARHAKTIVADSAEEDI
jgi:peptide/nickel transport system permease protein